MNEKLDGSVMQVDIHAMVKQEAKLYLTDILDHEGEFLKELIVIHGYRNGQTLQHFVREEFSHKRIKARIKGLNKGQTTLLLKS